MTDLCRSENYLWSTTWQLGKGTFGAVYKGMKTTNGELVAIKIPLRAQNIPKRELDVLQKVNHENIVKLLAIEEINQDKTVQNLKYQEVIVLELCTGGSLDNVLRQPANVFGLQDLEFLLVLDHLTAGMKYLRDYNLTHRDLKPGNILKFIHDNGKIIYKLTDFGAARELSDEQHFKSFHGTGEYMRPDMYASAYLQQTAKKSFDATVDLWSIGATLYHAATGNVPFYPYGDGDYIKRLYEITTRKSTGVISGIQETVNGPIEYRSDLPNDCQLSVGLRNVITPLLAGLLEDDQSKIWLFDQYFSTVTDILLLKPINVFHVASAVSIKIYMHPNHGYDQFQKYVTDQSGIPAEEQIILYQNPLFGDCIQENTWKVDDYVNTTESKPIFLFSCNNNRQQFPKFNGFPEARYYRARVDIITHQYKQGIEMYLSRCKLICDAIDKFNDKIKEDLRTLKQVWQRLVDKTTILGKTIQSLSHSADPENVLEINLYKALKMTEQYVTNIILNVQDHIVDNNVVTTLFDQQYKTKLDERETISKIRNSFHEVLKYYQNIVDNNVVTTLFDQQYKTKLDEREVIRKIRNSFHEVLKYYQELRDNSLDTWYNSLQKDYLEIRAANRAMKQYSELLKQFELKLSPDAELIKKLLRFDINLINKKQLINNQLEELMKLVADSNKWSMENLSILDQYSIDQ